MIKITVYKQRPFPVAAKKIKDTVIKTFQKHGLVSDAEASVAIVNEKKMLELAKQYFKENDSLAASHPVLSFPTSEIQKPFVFPPDHKLDLGEIIISYPHAVKQAQSENLLIEEIVCRLAEHGALHLIGIHHS